VKIPRDTVAVCEILETICEHLGVTAGFENYVHDGVSIDAKKLEELVTSVKAIEAAMPMFTKDFR
jgi:hypothetical protein